jgi:hypothetical protein
MALSGASSLTPIKVEKGIFGPGEARGSISGPEREIRMKLPRVATALTASSEVQMPNLRARGSTMAER